LSLSGKIDTSIHLIKENKLITDDLNFKPVSSNFVSKQINKLNIKKATGYDGISPKILKLSMPCIVEHNNICITNIFCYVDEKVIENFRYLQTHKP
jgi:hypothetical protein